MEKDGEGLPSRQKERQTLKKKSPFFLSLEYKILGQANRRASEATPTRQQSVVVVVVVVFSLFSFSFLLHTLFISQS